MSSQQASADVQWYRPREFMLPSTFEERGAIVPFTTPVLNRARVRVGYRDQLELVIGQFANTNGHYVMPWKSLAELFTMTVYDSLLAEAVIERKALEPHAIRVSALHVNLTGLAGPEAAVAAAGLIKQDQEQRALQKIALYLKVIEATEQGALAELMREMLSSDGQDRIRLTLRRIMSERDFDPNLFEQRLLTLGEATAGIGLVANPEKGRLRLLLEQLDLFKRSLTAWANARPPEQASQAHFCAEVAGLTLDVGIDLLAAVDIALADPLTLLTGWHKVSPQVLRNAIRLGWLLDGWEWILAVWFQAETPAEQVSALAVILPIVPMVPRDELTGSGDPDAAIDLLVRGRRWVRPLENWKTGYLDQEMVRRLEAMKLTPAVSEAASEVELHEAALRQLTGALPVLPEAKFLAAIAVLAPVAGRVEVSSVMEASRPRLRALRPPRPHSARRILCRPFEDLLCDRILLGEDALVPRRLIGMLWTRLVTLQPHRLAKIRHRLAGNPDAATLADVSERLWQLGADTLRTARDLPQADRAVLDLVGDCLRSAGAIETFKERCPVKPIETLDHIAETAILAGVDQLERRHLPSDAFLFAVAARLANPVELGGLLDRSGLPQPIKLATRLEGIAVDRLVDQASQLVGDIATLDPDELTLEADQLLRVLSEVERRVSKKAATVLDGQTAPLKAALRTGIIGRVLEPAEAIVAPVLGAQPTLETMITAEQHARSLNRSRRFAAGLGLGDRVEATIAGLLSRFDGETRRALTDANGAARGQALQAKYRAIRMVELLAGSAAANKLRLAAIDAT